MSPLVLPMFGRLGAAERRLFWSMATATPPEFLKWGCQAILSWRPSPQHAPTFHLHGSDDHIIPVERVRPTQVLETAGHLPSLSHPVETTDFLSRVLAELA